MHDDIAAIVESITIERIVGAAERIGPHIVETPLVRSIVLSEAVGCDVWMKCENLQVVRAFKARGAMNAVFSLDDTVAERGVATHSSGNHGAALAAAASARGVAATVVMPRGSSRSKRDVVIAHGAKVVECAPTLDARVEALNAVVADTGAHFVHPYEDADVICGQGTVALEIVEQLDGHGLSPGAVVVPVGGGGLAAGVAVAVGRLAPGASVVGAEPQGADDAARGLLAGVRVAGQVPDTIADGLRTTLGRPNFEILKRHVADIVTVSDAAILDAMETMEAEAGAPVEPSGAVSAAAALSSPPVLEGCETIVVVLSGGNMPDAPGSGEGR